MSSPARSDCRSGTDQAQIIARAAPFAPATTGIWYAAAVAATPPIPPTANSASTVDGPCRRSSSHPYRPIAPRQANA